MPMMTVDAVKKIEDQKKIQAQQIQGYLDHRAVKFGAAQNSHPLAANFKKQIQPTKPSASQEESDLEIDFGDKKPRSLFAPGSVNMNKKTSFAKMQARQNEKDVQQRL